MNTSNHQQNSGYRWVILLIATIAQASACFFVQGIGAIAIYIQQDWHLSTLQIGLLVSAAQLVPIIGLLVAGELLDRFDERLVVGIGTLIVAVGLCASILASSYLGLLAFLIVVGAGYSTAQPGGSKSVSRWFPKHQLGFAMGIRQAGLPLGGAFSAAVLPYIAARWGWQYSFVAGGAVALFGAVVFLIFYRSASSVRPAGHKGDAHSVSHALLSRLSMLKEPAMKNIMFSGLSLISVQYGILIFTALYLYDLLDLTISAAALLLFIAQGSGVAGRIILAAWSDRCRSGRYFPVLTCMFAVVLGLLILVWAPVHSFWGLGVLVGWLGFFGFGWYGPWVAYVAESAPPDKTGFCLGLAMAINQVAIVVMPPALGLLKDVTHSYLPGWGVLIVMTLAALLFTSSGVAGAARLIPGRS
jgi:MFS family permease